MSRRFTNTSDVEIVVPTLGVAIAPGESADLDLPKDQPCPDGLSEGRKSRVTEPAPKDGGTETAAKTPVQEA